MASMFKKVIDYVGLSPDEQYDTPGIGRSSADSTGDEQPTLMVADPKISPSVTGVRAESTSVRVVADTPRPSSHRASSPTVRPIPAAVGAKPTVVVPASFGDAQRVADEFKAEVPVVMDLRSIDRELSRRLIDFASGMCYGVGGKMERIEHQMFLIIPDGVEVLEEDRRPLLKDGA